MGQIRTEAIQNTRGVTVTSIYDVESQELPNHVRSAGTPEDIFRDPKIDAICICTPNHLNKPHTIAGLVSGKHVFCEKPPAFTGTDVIEIRAHEQESGRKLMYGFNHRHHESIKRMKQLVTDETMGRVLWMRGRYGKEVNDSFFDGWRAKKELAGGGIMLDQGIHMLDLMLHLGGDFDEVHAVVSNLFWKIDGIEDNVFAILKNTRSEICASLHSTMTQWRYLFSLEVFLEKGAMVLNGLKTSSGAYGSEDLAIKHNTNEGTFTSEERLIFHEDTSWSSEIQHFVECIQSDKPIRHGSSSDALRVMNLIDQIYEAKQE